VNKDPADDDMWHANESVTAARMLSLPGGRGRNHRRAPIIAHARPRVDPRS